MDGFCSFNYDSTRHLTLIISSVNIYFRDLCLFIPFDVFYRFSTNLLNSKHICTIAIDFLSATERPGNFSGGEKWPHRNSFIFRIFSIAYCQLIVNVYYTDRNLLDYLLLNLAIADSSTVLFLSPKYIFSHTFSHPEGSLGNALCIAVTGGNIGWIGAVTSVFCLVAIAAERYYAVVHPIKYVSRPLRKSNLKVRLLQFIAPAGILPRRWNPEEALL